MCWLVTWADGQEGKQGSIGFFVAEVEAFERGIGGEKSVVVGYAAIFDCMFVESFGDEVVAVGAVNLTCLGFLGVGPVGCEGAVDAASDFGCSAEGLGVFACAFEFGGFVPTVTPEPIFHFDVIGFAVGGKGEVAARAGDREWGLYSSHKELLFKVLCDQYTKKSEK